MRKNEEVQEPGWLEHAAKVQLYRWCQLYEREFNRARIDNQLEILDKDIEVNSIFGITKGKQDYPKRLTAFEDTTIAHHVREVKIGEAKGGKLPLSAQVTYQRLLDDGKESSNEVRYQTLLNKNGELLPKFTRIKLVNKGGLKSLPFRDAYPENRIRSLVHYWLLLLEHPGAPISAFKEILTSVFSLDLSGGIFINRMEGLATWLHKIRASDEIAYRPENISVQKIVENRYEVYVDFISLQHIAPNRLLKKIARHRWLIHDNPDERFARIGWASVIYREKEETAY